MVKAGAKRCAIYTRKSTDEGLEQDFNSLDAQREACAAYILSQAQEGWEASPEHYDDGGYSGGSMDRPGLKQLLTDIEAGKIDNIVVYKVDRLTRSLADFAKIVEILDEKGASFVSVTQAFNTTNSMGRLTLNVLLSFAQFEREVTGERIRDKFAASKKKGMWMGGASPLGYKVIDRKLLIEETEADHIRFIFKRYAELKSVPRLVKDLKSKGIYTRMRISKSGNSHGGIAFTNGPLRYLLINSIYIGKIRHKDKIYDGEHEAIISEELFNEVQSIIADNRYDRMLGKRIANPSMLTGMLTDPDGRAMAPKQSRKGSRRYRYYETRSQLIKADEKAWRISAAEIEDVVVKALSIELENAAKLQQDSRLSDAPAAKKILEKLQTGSLVEKREALLNLKSFVNIHADHIDIQHTLGNNDEPKILKVDAKLIRKGHQMKLAIAPDSSVHVKQPDAKLQELIAKSFAARDHLVDGKDSQLTAGYSSRHLHRLARISYLAPDIITAIIIGTQPVHLASRQLLRMGSLPIGWKPQRQLLGFS